MRLVCAVLQALILVVVSPIAVLAQSSSPASVPRLVNITGIFRPADGQPLNAVETVTLSLYADQEDGTPLWQETQSIALDDRGRYALLLGGGSADGIPPAVFASGEARWLGTRFERKGEAEQARMRITSVPYSLRAGDAETLGGRPASAYLLAPGPDGGEQHGAVAPGDKPSEPRAVLPGTTNFLAKYVNAADVGDSALYESAGAVGLGTTTPLDRFHVRFTNAAGGFTGLAVQNLASTATSYSGMLFYDQAGELGQFQGFNNSTHEYRINNIARAAPGGAFNGSINFMTGSTSRFIVATNGNIGIGTTAPSEAVEVVRGGAEGGAFFLATSFGAEETNGGSAFVTRNARGTAAAPAAVELGDSLGYFAGNGYGTSGFGDDFGGGMGVIAAEDWTDDAHGALVAFISTPLGATEGEAHMAIMPDGNVGIGTFDEIPTIADKLQVFGDIRVGTTGTSGCVKDFNGDAIAGTCSSDRRFKKDITPFGQVLDRLTALEPVHYFWRASEFPDRHFGPRRAYGLIAQDVEQVLPELVVTNADGFKAVDYSGLPLLTIQAVKDLKSENDALKARVAELERLVTKMLTTTAPRP